jgi:preprotein translocase subunit SecE
MADKQYRKGVVGFAQKAFDKVVKTLLDIRAELKKVIWPDRRKLIQSTGTVIAIVLVFGIVIWVVDTVLSVFLTSIGFFSPSAVVTATPTPAITATVSPTGDVTPAAATATPTTAPTATVAPTT